MTGTTPGSSSPRLPKDVVDGLRAGARGGLDVYAGAVLTGTTGDGTSDPAAKKGR